jgi:succinyl-CoA synthetase beta subunit
MKLIEVDGKKLFREAGIQVPDGFLLPLDATSVNAWNGPCFVKSQVLSGRRGARGLVQRCDRVEDVPQLLDVLRVTLGDSPCAGFLCEAASPIREEWFISVDVDRRAGQLRVTLSAQGGMGVASAQTRNATSPDEARTVDAPQGVQDVAARLVALVQKGDLLHAEINPLGVREDGSCIALDAKVETDDAASFRHPEWALFAQLTDFGRLLTEREAAYQAFAKQAGHRGTFGRYIELDGDIACVFSGGGASLVALDALLNASLRAANYVELSGNPDAEGVKAAASILFSKPGLRAIWIAGSHANFTDIGAMTESLLGIIEEMELRLPIVIRRDGPRANEAQAFAASWSTRTGVPVLFHRSDVTLEQSARILADTLQTL